MGTVIYVHGTATRLSDNYLRGYAEIERRIVAANLGVTLDRVLWGNEVGASWPAVLRSIPGFEHHEPGGVLGALDEEMHDNEDQTVALWQQLYNDPLAELRLLALERGNLVQSAFDQSAASATLAEGMNRLVDGMGSSFSDLLQQGGITDTFLPATQRIAALFDERSGTLYSSLISVPDEAEARYRAALARAVVALALDEALVRDRSTGSYPPPYRDAELRDRLVEVIDEEIEAAGVLGFGDGIAKAALWPIMPWLRQARYDMMTGVVKFVGDVLAYQARGQQMRDQVLARIAQAEPPVTLLAHSLGGIICVDLLLTGQPRNLLDKVQLLITFGSQSPLLYEINALQSQKQVIDDKLPEVFPPWLNIYDRNDFLSFQAANLFMSKYLADYAISTGQPFPFAHSAYIQRDAFWDLVIPAIQNPKEITILRR